jgi:uncharacterized protein with gpF-like domain
MRHQIMHRPGLQFDAETPPRFNPGSLNVDASDLIRWIEAKNPQAIEHWRDLGNDEYSRAFTVARSAGYDIIDDLYFSFVDTLEKGGTEVDFAKLVAPTLKAKGWLRGDDQAIATRVQLIYDTNLRVARGAGQWDRVQAGKRALPYLRAATARDERVRHPPKSRHSDHRAWDGIVLPVDHPFWTRWWPPLGFRCRCTIIPMTRSQLARSNYFETSDADLEAREKQLGTPIFKAPGAGVTAQLNDIAQAENNPEGRMPGLPDVNVPAERANGLSLWGAQTAALLVDTLLDRLLG